MSQLVAALSRQDETTAGALWPEILSYEFWQLPVSDIWQISWEVNDSKDKITWSSALLENPELKPIALLFLTLAGKYQTETAETMLDYLVGSKPLRIIEAGKGQIVIESPLREYYTSAEKRKTSPDLFYEFLSHLSVIRAKLRDYQAARLETLSLKDFLDFVALYNASETRMINSSPYTQAAEAVQLMTVFKAKGQEFEYVYLPACVDEVWGESSRGNSNKLTLPPNLAPIRHIGATQDERLRIFFVALTRAKRGLYLTSYASNYAGKATRRLKYLDEQSEDGIIYQTMTFPASRRANILSDHDAPPLTALLSSWQDYHTQAASQASLRELLLDRLARYQLSPTHLNRFFDLVYGGPEAFFFDFILRFPTAPTPTSQYGSAIHETLQWLQLEVNRGKFPKEKSTIEYFKTRLLNKKLAPQDTALLSERGEQALAKFLTERSSIYKSGNIAEHNFRREGVLIDNAHLTGKIDLLEMDKKNKTLTVVDYKTGPSHSKWASDLRLHKYKQQLYMYKLLIEGSYTFKGYKVVGGRLEFIEPDSDGQIQRLELDFQDTELEHVKKLAQVMWQKVKVLDLPDISAYDATLAAIKQFEKDLISSSD
jgi:DNA helicase-2/ATP-dependent DNA helicase PcrA